MTSVKNSGKQNMQSEFEKKTMAAFAWFVHYSQKKVWDVNTKLGNLYIESTIIGPPPTVSFRLTVTPEMCNHQGVFRAGCAATYTGPPDINLACRVVSTGILLAVWSRSELEFYCFSTYIGWKDVRIVCSVINAGKRMATLNAEIHRVGTGELCIVGVHEKMNTDPSSLQKF